MWQELFELRQQYQQQERLQTEIHRNYVRNLFLYQVLQLSGNPLSEQAFEEIVSTGKPQHQPEARKAYDLWKAWEHIEESASLHVPFTLTFVQKVAACIMKHTGGETTTTIGEFDSSLGDFRLGEDYNEIYPIADFRHIPALLDQLCKTTKARLLKAGAEESIRLSADFVYDFMHIRPFGNGNTETALLLMNYIQLFHNHPLLMIYAEDRAQLLNTLKRGEISIPKEEFENFIAEQQIKFLRNEL